jgi:hypothetical protein
MNIFWMMDWGQRLFIYPFIREDITVVGLYNNDLTPGSELASIAFAMTVLLFLISVANRKEK